MRSAHDLYLERLAEPLPIRSAGRNEMRRETLPAEQSYTAQQMDICRGWRLARLARRIGSSVADVRLMIATIRDATEIE